MSEEKKSGRRSKVTEVSEDLPDVPTPPLFDTIGGTIKVYRTWPDDGYVGTVDCSPIPPDEERLLSEFGPGKYDLKWFPPPESDLPPRTRSIKLHGDRKPQGEGSGLGGYIMAELRDLKTQNRELLAERSDFLSTQAAAMLDHQRQLGEHTLATVVGIMQQQTQSTIQMMAASTERQRAIDREDRDRTAQFHREDMERRDQQGREMLALYKAAQNPSSSPEEQLQQTARLIELVRELGGGDVETTTLSAALEAAPAILEKGAQLLGRGQPDRPARRPPPQLPAPANTEPDLGGAAWGEIDDDDAPPATTPAGDQVDQVDAEQPAGDQVDQVDAGDGGNGQHIDPIAWGEFCGWIATMEYVAVQHWEEMIKTMNQDGALPELVVAPLYQAFTGGDIGPLRQLFAAAEAEDMLDSFLRHKGLMPAEADGDDQDRTPTDLRPDDGPPETLEPDGRVEETPPVGQPDVDGGTG
ncbi:MAG: hypothetical protein K0U84_14115 [Actinomycetia bacterium]|nr:hypothetical protein [Actinomycetes bacterium]